MVKTLIYQGFLSVAGSVLGDRKRSKIKGLWSDYLADYLRIIYGLFRIAKLNNRGGGLRGRVDTQVYLS